MKADRLTSTIALDMVKRIEALHEQIDAIYAEARKYPDINNDNVIRDAVEARRAERNARAEAEGLIGSFDWNEEGERVEPGVQPEAKPEAAWPRLSTNIRKAAGGNRKILKEVDLLDRLHQILEERGLPVVTAEELKAHAP